MSALERLLAETLVLLAALCLAALAGHHYGAAGVQAEWDRDKLVRATATTTAVVKRVDDNKMVTAKQAADNTDITKEKDHEIADLRQRLATAGRLRVGAAVCPDRLAATANAESPAGGDGADPSAGLVSAAADRDFKQLIVDVETDLATGRACQAFLDKNGLVP